MDPCPPRHPEHRSQVIPRSSTGHPQTLEMTSVYPCVIPYDSYHVVSVVSKPLGMTFLLCTDLGNDFHKYQVVTLSTGGSLGMMLLTEYIHCRHI